MPYLWLNFNPFLNPLLDKCSFDTLLVIAMTLLAFWFGILLLIEDSKSRKIWNWAVTNWDATQLKGLSSVFCECWSKGTYFKWDLSQQNSFYSTQKTKKHIQSSFSNPINKRNLKRALKFKAKKLLPVYSNNLEWAQLEIRGEKRTMPLAVI